MPVRPGVVSGARSPGRPGRDPGRGNGLGQAVDVVGIARRHHPAAVAGAQRDDVSVHEIGAASARGVQDGSNPLGQLEVGVDAADRGTLYPSGSVTLESGLDGLCTGTAATRFGTDDRWDEHRPVAIVSLCEQTAKLDGRA